MGWLARQADDDAAVLFVWGMSQELLDKLKRVGALQGKTLGEYVQQMCHVHIEKLGKEGILPKSK